MSDFSVSKLTRHSNNMIADKAIKDWNRKNQLKTVIKFQKIVLGLVHCFNNSQLRSMTFSFIVSVTEWRLRIGHHHMTTISPQHHVSKVIFFLFQQSMSKSVNNDMLVNPQNIRKMSQEQYSIRWNCISVLKQLCVPGNKIPLHTNAKRQWNFEKQEKYTILSRNSHQLSLLVLDKKMTSSTVEAIIWPSDLRDIQFYELIITV